MTKQGYFNNKFFAFFNRLLIVFLTVFGLAIRFTFYDVKTMFYYCPTCTTSIFAVIYCFSLVFTAYDLNKNGLYGKAFCLSPLLSVGLVVIGFFAMFLRGSASVYVDFDFIYNPSLLTWTKLSEIIIHYAVPALVFFDWLFFIPKGKLKLKYSLYWTLLPIIYMATIFITAYASPNYNLVAGRFPYRIFNIDKNGVFMTALATFGLWLATLILGIGFVLTDKFLHTTCYKTIKK